MRRPPNVGKQVGALMSIPIITLNRKRSASTLERTPLLYCVAFSIMVLRLQAVERVLPPVSDTTWLS